MNERDPELLIRVTPLRDHLLCPICMSHLRQAHITTCGHRYCEACIKECVNQLHKCPLCNGPLKPDQLIRDSQFDSLLETIQLEETEAERNYFSRLIGDAAESAVSGESHEQSSGDIRKLFSPVELVLKEIEITLMQELKSDSQKRRALIDDELKTSLERLQASSVNGEDLARSMKYREEEAQMQKENLEAEMARCSKLVAEAYDKYLSEHIPSLSVLPVTVTLSLINKGITINDVRLKPHDSINDVKQLICEEMSKRGDSLVSFGDDIKFLCFSPLARRSLFEMARIASEVLEQNISHPDVTVLPNACSPVLQYSVRPGSEIAVYGTVKCESDIPKKCFSKTFNPDDVKAMDYFTCVTCSNVNWICRPCMDVCHKDHIVKPYIFGHQPKWSAKLIVQMVCGSVTVYNVMYYWACCYCIKKKTCLIQS